MRFHLVLPICFSLGIAVVSYLPSLPPPYFAPFLFIISLLCCLVFKRFRSLWVALCGFTLGVAWAGLFGAHLIKNQLNPEWEGKTFAVVGRVSSMAQMDDDKTRFQFAPIEVWDDSGAAVSAAEFPARLLISWYFRNADPVVLKPGELWRLEVKLKRPRGLANFGGFDYQAWLLRKGIGAKGYVLSGHPSNRDASSALGLAALSDAIETWRTDLLQWVMNHRALSEKSLLVALLIGDTSQLDKTQWQRMLRTGTNHLMAISGLHIGFLALAGHCLGLLLGRFIQLIWRYYPAQFYAYWGALIFAATYSALAGFNIPTMRTFIMLSVFYLALMRSKNTPISFIYCLALALVLATDPLATCDIGFWLSFGAVGLLLMTFSGRYAIVKHPPYGTEVKHLLPLIRQRAWQWFGGYSRSQWVMFIGLMIPLGLLVNTVPLLAPIANFIAIPLVTLWVVPSLLLAAVLSSVMPEFSDWLLSLANWGLEWLKLWLDVLLAQENHLATPILSFNPWQLALLLVSVLILLLPRGLLSFKWGLFGLIIGISLAVLPRTDSPALRVSVLDVGQGTAVVVTTPHHQLLYDTGPKYSDNFDAGSGIVLPYLHHLGINHLNALVLSHWDMDHAGGLEGVFAGIPIETFYWGEPVRDWAEPGAEALSPKPAATFSAVASPRVDLPAGRECHSQNSWVWDGVQFQFLRWPIAPSDSANNHSCVLLIRLGDQTVLLPGDIEKYPESALLQNNQLPQGLTVLLAAHHGSQTSSNPAFAAYTQPQWVVYSSGYHNRFRHPHPRVLERFQRAGATGLNTANEGAIEFHWSESGALRVAAARRDRRRYWFDDELKH